MLDNERLSIDNRSRLIGLTHSPLFPTDCAPRTAIFTSDNEDFFRRIPRVVILIERLLLPHVHCSVFSHDCLFLLRSFLSALRLRYAIAQRSFYLVRFYKRQTHSHTQILSTVDSFCLFVCRTTHTKNISQKSLKIHWNPFKIGWFAYKPWQFRHLTEFDCFDIEPSGDEVE